MTDHQCLDVKCPDCGLVTSAELPEGVPTGQYDPSVQAMTGLLRGELKQSVRQTSAVMTELFHVPMSTGNLNDGIIAYANGRMVVLRVPYPIGFYAKGFDGRIDDPKAGWKGRGLWAANGDRTPWLIEGGKGTKPLAAHFQLRPDPLAK